MAPTAPVMPAEIRQIIKDCNRATRALIKALSGVSGQHVIALRDEWTNEWVPSPASQHIIALRDECTKQRQTYNEWVRSPAGQAYNAAVNAYNAAVNAEIVETRVARENAAIRSARCERCFTIHGRHQQECC